MVVVRLFVTSVLLASILVSQGFVGSNHVPRLQRMRSAVEGGDASAVVAEISSRISTELQTKEIEITSANDDPNGMHISIFVVSDIFEKLNRVKRQQSVYRVIKQEMNAGIIHAVDELRCLTPSEFQALS